MFIRTTIRAGGRAEAPNFNLQPPKKLQIPTSKVQSHQIPNFKLPIFVCLVPRAQRLTPQIGLTGSDWLGLGPQIHSDEPRWETAGSGLCRWGERPREPVWELHPNVPELV